jgi:hypothetical protein
MVRSVYRHAAYDLVDNGTRCVTQGLAGAKLGCGRMSTAFFAEMGAKVANQKSQI